MPILAIRAKIAAFGSGIGSAVGVQKRAGSPKRKNAWKAPPTAAAKMGAMIIGKKFILDRCVVFTCHYPTASFGASSFLAQTLPTLPQTLTAIYTAIRCSGRVGRAGRVCGGGGAKNLTTLWSSLPNCVVIRKTVATHTQDE